MYSRRLTLGKSKHFMSVVGDQELVYSRQWRRKAFLATLTVLNAGKVLGTKLGSQGYSEKLLTYGTALLLHVLLFIVRSVRGDRRIKTTTDLWYLGIYCNMLVNIRHTYAPLSQKTSFSMLTCGSKIHIGHRALVTWVVHLESI